MKETYKRDSFIIRGILLRIEKAFNLYEDGLDEIGKYLIDGDCDNILEGLDIVRSAVNRLHKSLLLLYEEDFLEDEEDFLEDDEDFPEDDEDFLEEDEEEDFLDEEIKKMDMAWREKICPVMTEDEEYFDFSEDEEYYTNPNFERLSQEVDMFKEGKISEEKFASFLTWMSLNLEAGRRDFGDISSYGEEPELEKLITSAIDAFRMYERGIEEMKKYFSDKDFIHLDNGLDMAFEATQVIAQLELSFEDPEAVIFLD